MSWHPRFPSIVVQALLTLPFQPWSLDIRSTVMVGSVDDGGVILSRVLRFDRFVSRRQPGLYIRQIAFSYYARMQKRLRLIR